MKSRDPVKTAQKALFGGVDILQIRDKSNCDREIIAYGTRLKRIAGLRGVPLIVNDRIDICKILDADGAHLGQGDIPLQVARSILGRNKIIGISCHSIGEAVRAEREGADYIAVGPVFKSPTKPRLRPRGLNLLKAVAGKVKVPVVAIGGIDRKNVASVMGCGADVIAVVNAIAGKKNVRRAASELKEEISKVGRK